MPRRGKGEGSIFQRKDGRWAAFVTVGYGPDGKQQKRWVYGRTRREVAEKLARLLPKAGYGVIQPSRLRLGEWLERWAAEHVRTHNIRPSTAAKYEEYKASTHDRDLTTAALARFASRTQNLDRSHRSRVRNGQSTRPRASSRAAPRPTPSRGGRNFDVGGAGQEDRR